MPGCSGAGAVRQKCLGTAERRFSDGAERQAVDRSEGNTSMAGCERGTDGGTVQLDVRGMVGPMLSSAFDLPTKRQDQARLLRQPIHDETSPPIVGPNAIATPDITPIRANNIPRSQTGEVAA